MPGERKGDGANTRAMPTIFKGPGEKRRDTTKLGQGKDNGPVQKGWCKKIHRSGTAKGCDMDSRPKTRKTREVASGRLQPHARRKAQ